MTRPMQMLEGTVQEQTKLTDKPLSKQGSNRTFGSKSNLPEIAPENLLQGSGTKIETTQNQANIDEIDQLAQTGENNMNTEFKTMDINSKQPFLHKELFGNDPVTNKIIVCENEYTDFGFCNALQVSGQREVTIQNTSGTKLTVSWTRNYIENSDIPIFSVNPQSANLRAGESFNFCVNFRPTHRSAFFFQKLQAIAVNYEENLSEFLSGAGNRMRKKKLKELSSGTNTKTQSFPPVMITTNCVGHSFAPGNQPFIPMIDVLPGTRICFAPRSLGQSAYATIQLLNKTDTPTLFRFDRDVTGVFDIWPKMGMLGGNKFTVCV